MLACFYALALVLEPPLLRLAERVAVRWSLGASLLAIAAVAGLASICHRVEILLVLVAIYGPASGIAVSAAEGTLVEAAPEQRERTLARLTLAAGIGDLAVPALLALIGWRGSFQIAAGLAIALALIAISTRALDRPAAAGESDETPPRLRDAIRHRTLLGWSIATALGNLMDEVAAAFVAVHLHAQLEGGLPAVAIALGAWTLGGIAGLVILDRALERVRPMHALAIAGALSLASFAIAIVSRDLVVVCAMLALLGASAATFHPLLKARTYASLPGHPGVVNAVAALLTPLDIAAALALGAIAELAGSHAALWTLAAVPAAMLAIGLRFRRDARTDPEESRPIPGEEPPRSPP